MVNSYHQKSFKILKLNIMSKLNVKTCNANKIFEKEVITSDIFKMVTFDNNFFSEEDLDNIGNGNEVDGNVNEGISDNEEMKKILKIGKKDVDELNGRTNM